MKKYLFICLILALAACTEEQSKAIGQQPKKTVDRVTTDVNKAMQQGQGSERLKEEEPK
jgi:hypothetical protein